MSKIVMKTVCYGGVQVRQNNNLCTSIFIRAKKKLFLPVQKYSLRAQKGDDAVSQRYCEFDWEFKICLQGALEAIS